LSGTDEIEEGAMDGASEFCAPILSDSAQAIWASLLAALLIWRKILAAGVEVFEAHS